MAMHRRKLLNFPRHPYNINNTDNIPNETQLCSTFVLNPMVVGGMMVQTTIDYFIHLYTATTGKEI